LLGAGATHFGGNAPSRSRVFLVGTAPQRLGDRAASLQRDIVALAQEIAPNGWLEEVIESGALIGRRPEEEDSR